MTDFSIRLARAGDQDLIVALLGELAAYEKLLDRFRDYARYRYARLPMRAAFAVLRSAVRRRKPAGIATWHWTYGSFAAARKIYLADLFVRPEFRGKHYGKALIGHLAKQVLTKGGVGIDWEVLDWNRPSIESSMTALAPP